MSKIITAPLELQEHRNEGRLDSRLFAKQAGIQHESLSRLIHTHAKALRELGTLPRFEIGVTRRIGATRQFFYLLNEAQFDHLLKYVRGRDKARMDALKLAATKAFAARRAAEPLRVEYLPTYHRLHDVVKVLAERDREAGHTTDEQWLHANINKLINKAVGLDSGMRGTIRPELASTIATLQRVAETALIEAERDGKGFSEAYQLAKARVGQVLALLGLPGRTIAANDSGRLSA